MPALRRAALRCRRLIVDNWTLRDIPDLGGRIAIVTGANSGLGYWTSLHLARHGADVVMACRSMDKGEAARQQILAVEPNARLSVMPLDLADLDSTRRFGERFLALGHPLHLLCNNAGLAMPPQDKTRQGFELQFGTNFLGHFALTGHLLPALRTTAAARVVHVASIAHRMGRIAFDDLHFERRTYKQMPSYGQSKLANLMFAFELQRRFATAGIDAISVAAHPGYAATNISAANSIGATRFGQWAVQLGDRLLGQPAESGAAPQLFACTSADVRGGEYFGPSGAFELRGRPKRVGSTAAARDEGSAARLWEVAENLTGVHYL